MADRAPDRLTFREFTLDLRTRGLSHRGLHIALRPKSFDVLAYLVGNPGRLVAKDEIIDAVWPNVITSDDSLSRCISDARSAIGDTDKDVIRTVPGRGYHFAAEVSALVAEGGPGAAGAEPGGRIRRSYVLAASGLFLAALAAVIALTIWDTPSRDSAETQWIYPSIVILPFRNNSADSAIDRFASGLTSDLNSALARVPDLLVISESAARKYAGAKVDPRQAAEETGVGHVLSGTIQEEGRQGWTHFPSATPRLRAKASIGVR